MPRLNPNPNPQPNKNPKIYAKNPKTKIPKYKH